MVPPFPHGPDLRGVQQRADGVQPQGREVFGIIHGGSPPQGVYHGREGLSRVLTLESEGHTGMTGLAHKAKPDLC